ncbi:pilus assembly protein TadG-related protein [Streptomyces sp. NBC_00048]|uniref:pilus assembly protein TadG-related protein n=1 Tax=Streptomyces sp. NBC_00048 TaxID=2975628 RepID=UPI00324C9B24
MTARRLGDRGQAFPIYIVVVAGLLFAALAFFVVGMAGATRSNAQGAADAAALAAAREARDKVFVGIDLGGLKPTDWEAILDVKRFNATGACSEAERFAALNDAKATCKEALPRFTVNVKTEDAVGDSVVPGSGETYGFAEATAVIESRCSLGHVAAASPSPSPPPTPSPTARPGGPPKLGSVNFVCEGVASFKLDPLNPGPLSRLARNLFSVRLVD